jgi:hypothetical protein
MRIAVLILLFINLYSTAFSQTIKGTVLDKQTFDSIPYATVYFNGTFVGTSSDQNGNFELNITEENRSKPITASCIGYHSATLTDFSETEPLIIYMQAQLYDLPDASIIGKSLERKRRRYLRLLKDELIGTTINARRCKILNEEDITFNYDSDDDTIKAYALAPLLIENKALGYNITYYLDRFEYYKRSISTFFSGNFIFNDDLIDDPGQTEIYNKRRVYTYLGSRMHFFRVLWSGQLKSSGFTIRNSSNRPLRLDKLVFQDDLQYKYLSFPTSLLINYYDRRSTIEFVMQPVYFDESGYFDPGIKWTGDMARQRIADWLPYEYAIEE